MTSKASKYYIAYGSNLSVEQMKVRTPDAVIAGTGMLTDCRLLFRRYATIEKCKGYSVPVLVWSISKQDERNLDHYEGYPNFYVKETLKVQVTSLEGESLGEVPAMVYVMTDAAAEIRGISPLPSKQYFDTLRAGYEMFGFDVKFLAEALSEALAYNK